MTNENDVRPGGLSSCGSSQQAVSPVPASIPDAEQWWALVLAAYDAGVRRGNDEATAFEWGERPRDAYHDELVSAVHDWMSEGRDWRAGDIVTFETASAVVAQAIEARKGGDAKQAPSQDESAVGETDAPNPADFTKDTTDG